MNDSATLLMYGVGAWDGVWYSRHHLALGLARRHRVVLVEAPEGWRRLVHHPGDMLRPGRLTQDARGLLQFRSPGYLPEILRWPTVRRGLHWGRARALLRAAGHRRQSRTICYVWNPEHQEAVLPLGRLPLVYHCYDKYDRYTGVPQEQIARHETWLARRAALCVAASTRLGEHLHALGARQVHILRHGVDAEVFRPGLPAPAAVAAIPRPRIGVVARLNEGLDVETLMEVARRRPDWSLVLVGGVFFTDAARRARFEELCRLPNVHQVGLQPPNTIPAWLGGFDVALACYDLGSWGPYNQPIKIYEYLACGLPVVASDIAAAEEMGDLVARCATTDAWIPAIEGALARRSAHAVARRVAFARANSWKRRVEELDEVLSGLIG